MLSLHIYASLHEAKGVTASGMEAQLPVPSELSQDETDRDAPCPSVVHGKALTTGPALTLP